MIAARAAGATIAVGVGLTVIYTALISSADAITKMFAASYAAPQLFALSGGIVALLAVLVNRAGPNPRGVATRCPRAMAIRSTATVLGAGAFFYAFRLLPFAEVFLFIAMIPLITALLSGPVLGEAVRPQAWGAVCLGMIGLLCLAPRGLGTFQLGHAVALAAVLLGTVSMMASRYIGLRDGNLLAQVFWPNLALAGVSALALPFVWAPMGLGDLGWAVLYAGLLFAARWVLVGALKALPAYVITPLMNLQFLWMVAIGAAVFGEVPGTALYLGAALVITAGAWLIYDQAFPNGAARKVVPAE
ncbi:EamA-like transporter family protein [Roseovarius nanhaiticus]|uniref:EamA-like transporter family protein n=1 Tax=Roseovarius nanhaiticus TaxID=573024 RepID=A0A1N7GCZ3_9RHOB|nr:DMT family transporter [Roseovarius nanhaiticus]SEK30330.1 EamA-like transporter family protein [Roseovarius nanhaiticus]SIS10433.1 EamA-like transporter family protein [Roseovarius nanhaiticus]